MATPLNETVLINAIPALTPLFESIRAIIASLQWLVGGIFGLYLILIFLRWRESRVVARVLKEIRDDIRELSESIKLVNDKVNKHHKKKKL